MDYALVRVTNSQLRIRGLGSSTAGDRGFFRATSSEASPPLSSASALLPPVEDYDYTAMNRPPRHLVRKISTVSVENPVAQLGRVLFYDRRLSANGAVSCASCHQQEYAFADNRRFSAGFAGVATERNSHTLLGLRTYTGRNPQVFMDGRAPDLRQAIASVIEHPEEMGLSAEGLVERLHSEPYYAELWAAAFDDPAFSAELAVEALAQFLEALPMFSSRYDRFLAGDLTALDSVEQSGKQIFGQHCASCHREPGLGGEDFFNNGLDAVTTDPGRGAVTGRDDDLGKFRPPTLRNIARTAPYMHDGRFATLREVIDFYADAVQPHPNLDPKLGGPLNLEESEREELEAFLRALDDVDTLANPAFSDPFRSEVLLSPPSSANR